MRQISIQAERRAQRQTHPRRENLSKDPVRMRVHWRVVSRQSTTFLCDVPTVDLSQDRTALSGKFAEDELKAGRELELQNMLNFDAFELVDELPPRKHAYDMVWFGEWRGDRVRSRLCMSVQGRGNPGRHVCGGNARHVFHQVFVGKSSEFQGLWNPCHRHFCCIHARSNR